VGKYVIEEPFYPLPANPGSSILRGLDAGSLPPLLGYNGTSAKNTARLDLITPRGDPLLAYWQFGLGRAAAWMSDLKGQWATRWLSWEGFPRFVSQLVVWTLPAPRVEGLSATAKLQDNQAVIQVQAVKKDGSPYNFLTGVATIIDPKLEKSELPLKQIGAGQYQAVENVSEPGVYLVRVGANNGDQSLGQMTLGLVVPYSPEYRFTGIDEGLLKQLAQLTGGNELNTNQLNSVFNRQGLIPTENAREIWLPFLILAALLFPIDVAIRRLTWKKRDFAQAYAWMKARIPLRQSTEILQPRLLTGLFEARQRARQRTVAPPVTMKPAPGEKSPAPQQKEAQPALKKQTEPQNRPETEIDALERLRQAKKRANRK
jgi:hypothetical protein